MPHYLSPLTDRVMSIKFRSKIKGFKLHKKRKKISYFTSKNNSALSISERGKFSIQAKIVLALPAGRKNPFRRAVNLIFILT